MSTFDIFKRLFGAGAQERREKPRVNARDGTRVLIVDDSSTIVALLRKMLRQSNYVTLEAGDAESGIEIARAERPDLMFLDIVLPGMNGFSALRILRRDPATKNMPIIMMSGNEQATEQFYAQRIGADDFMKKPFSRSEVFARIDRLLDVDLVPKRAAFSLLSETPQHETADAGHEPVAHASPAAAVPAPAPAPAPAAAAVPPQQVPQPQPPQPQPAAPIPFPTPAPALAAVPSPAPHAPLPPAPAQPHVVPVPAVTAAPRAPAPAPRPIAPAPSPYPWSSAPRPAATAGAAPARPAYAPPTLPTAPRAVPATAPSPSAPSAAAPDKPTGSESQG